LFFANVNGLMHSLRRILYYWDLPIANAKKRAREAYANTSGRT